MVVQSRFICQNADRSDRRKIEARRGRETWGLVAEQNVAVLSKEDREFWEENGYIVVHDAVPQENLTAVIDEIWEYLEMDPDDPDDWCRDPHNPDGMVEMAQTQGLWNNRQHPRVYGAFAEICGRPDLWVSLEQAHMKPPCRSDRPSWDHRLELHWDLDSTVPLRGLRVQGVLNLTDTAQNQGGFRCVPGFHRSFEEWVKTQPEDRDPRRPNPEGMDVRNVPGQAGDLLIWNSLLPHGTYQNTADKPRLVQYIGMFPAREKNEAFRQRRIRLWRDRLSPVGRRDASPGEELQLEQRDGKTAKLSDLGCKLLGLESWD